MCLCIIQVTILTLAQLFWGPTVQTPSPVPSDSAVSLPFEIKNESVVPLAGVKYTCVLVSMQPRSGYSLKEIRSDYLSSSRVLWGRDSMTARCDASFMMKGIPIKQAEYRLELQYFALPWPFRRHAEYDFVFIPEPSGLTGKWMPK